MKFLETDTVCFVGGCSTLEKKQEELWTPLRQRFCDHYNVTLNTTGSETDAPLILETHPEETFSIVRHRLLDLSVWQLTSVIVATQQLKSLVIALDLLDIGRANGTSGADDADGDGKAVTDAINCSMLEEHHQRDFWGNDDESFKVNEDSMRRWLLACRTFSREMP